MHPPADDRRSGLRGRQGPGGGGARHGHGRDARVLRGRRPGWPRRGTRRAVGRAEGPGHRGRGRPAEAGPRGPAQEGRQPVVRAAPVRGRVPPVQPGRAVRAVLAGRERVVHGDHTGRAVRLGVQQHGRLPAARGQLRARGPAVHQGAGRRTGQPQGAGAPVPRVRRAQVVRRRGGRRAARAGPRARQRGSQALPGRGRAWHPSSERQLSRHGQEDVPLITTSLHLPAPSRNICP